MIYSFLALIWIAALSLYQIQHVQGLASVDRFIYPPVSNTGSNTVWYLEEPLTLCCSSFSKWSILCQSGSQQQIDGVFKPGDPRGFNERSTYGGVGKDGAHRRWWGSQPLATAGSLGLRGHECWHQRMQFMDADVLKGWKLMKAQFGSYFRVITLTLWCRWERIQQRTRFEA